MTRGDGEGRGVGRRNSIEGRREEEERNEERDGRKREGEENR